MSPSPESSYPIPVVRMFVADAEGRILILRRAPESAGGGQWCLPGGKVQSGQSVEEALRAELFEETALRLLDCALLFYDDGAAPAPGAPRYLNLYFRCAAEGAVALNAESTAFEWIGPRDAERFDFAFGHGSALLRFWASN